MSPASRRADRMRRFWDARARENAAWYVDTSLDYDDPDMVRFFETGVEVVRQALVDAPVQPERRDVAVEIGPGLGRICVALSAHFDRVIGIDVSEEMVLRARELVNQPSIEFVVGDGVSLAPLVDSSADFVTTFTVLQHLPSRELILDYLAEVGRVLRPGGIAALQWNNLPHPMRWRLKGWFWRTRRRIAPGRDTEERNAAEFLGTRLPFAAVRAALEAGGLTVRATAGEGTLFAWVWAEKG